MMRWGNLMSGKNNILRTAIAVFCILSMLSQVQARQVYGAVSAAVKTGKPQSGMRAGAYEFVLLTTRNAQMKIGDTFYLTAITSNGKKPKFSSDNSKVASVNTYGKITAKKAGTATITAKISNGEATCKVVVEKTEIRLEKKAVSLDNGYSIKLTAETSTGHPVTWKSSKKSVAVVDERGWVTAKKPGKVSITATADGASASCSLTVKEPKVTLSQKKVSLYRNQTAKLLVTSTSKSVPKWKSNKSSVASVDNHGNIRALKNGKAVITATVDGVKAACEVTVKKPSISFASQEVSIAVGESKKLQVTVSSGNQPVFSSSNTNIVSVGEDGTVHGKQPGKAYVYAKEDGAKEKIRVIVK